jgi:hypothetical protein
MAGCRRLLPGVTLALPEFLLPARRVTASAAPRFSGSALAALLATPWPRPGGLRPVTRPFRVVGPLWLPHCRPSPLPILGGGGLPWVVPPWCGMAKVGGLLWGTGARRKPLLACEQMRATPSGAVYLVGGIILLPSPLLRG